MESQAIRPALASDLESIYGIDPIAQSGSERRAAIKDWIATSTCYVSTSDEAVVSAYGVLNYSFYENGLVAMLQTGPELRQRGFATALMRYFEKICRTPKLFTSTNLSNLPMQSLLNKLNYRLCGVIHELDENDPELVYVKFAAHATYANSPMSPNTEL